MKRSAVLAFGLTVVAMAAGAFAENWPNWRGPFFNGTTNEKDLPGEWSAEKNVAWATPMPGPSAATPIVWGDRVFVSSTDANSDKLYALCLDAAGGKVLWQDAVDTGNVKIGNNNMASPSPVTDGERAIFLYGTGALACYDFNGKKLWAHSLTKEYGKFTIKYGYGSSPLLYKGKLYVAVMRNATDKQAETPNPTPFDSFLLALDPKTGKVIWKQDRKTDALDESLDAYTTPIPFEFAGRSQILLAGADYLTCQDAATGEEFWRFGYDPARDDKLRTVPSPTPGDGLAYVTTPRGGPLYAVKAGGKGPIPTNQAAWTYPGPTTDVCTPLCYEGRVYVLNDKKKNLLCLDAKTGAKKWEGALGGNAVYRCSPAGADGKVYCVSQGGEVVTLAAGDQFRVLSRVTLGGRPCDASVAISGGRLFIRTGDKLACVGKKP